MSWNYSKFFFYISHYMTNQLTTSQMIWPNAIIRFLLVQVWRWKLTSIIQHRFGQDNNTVHHQVNQIGGKVWNHFPESKPTILLITLEILYLYNVKITDMIIQKVYLTGNWFTIVCLNKKMLLISTEFQNWNALFRIPFLWAIINSAINVAFRSCTLFILISLPFKLLRCQP